MKQKIINNYKKMTNSIKKIKDEVLSDEKNYNKKTVSKFIKIYKFFYAVTRKFNDDDCFTKASAIAYTTLFSLVPTLTVILTSYYSFFAVGQKKEELFAAIAAFMTDHNIKINIDPILEAISSFIENAGKVGGIGAILMIFSATTVFRTIDKSFNDIWGIKIGRTIFLKIIYFWTALTLGPVLIITGNTLADQLTSWLSSPNYYSAEFTKNDKIWVVGSRARIASSDDLKANLVPISKRRIDFDNQIVYDFDQEEGTFVTQEFRVEEIEFANAQLRGIQFIDDSGWIVGKDGFFLFSNMGRRWRLRKYGSLDLNQIYMLNKDKGFITTDNGYLISTNDGWQHLAVKDFKNITRSLKSISFNNNFGIITGEAGVIITTNNGGKTWNHSVIHDAKIKKKYININSINFIDNERIALACDDGIILISKNAGASWEKKEIFDENYTSVLFVNSQTGYAAGNNGIFISTRDGGENWRKRTLSRSKINLLKIRNNVLWAFGDNGLALQSADNGKTWHGRKGKSFALYIIDFFAPFIFIWLLFLLSYTFFPNTKVPFKSAAIGAAFTSTIWVVFIMLFEIYVKAFSKGSLAIYGALAAIPIFLLMVYSSFVIVLYGAEVSYILMYPNTYLKLEKKTKNQKNIHLYYGIYILYYVYKKFESRKGATKKNELLKITSNNNEETDFFIDLFKKEKLLLELDDAVSPATSSRNVTVSEIINLIHDVSLVVPAVIPSKDTLRKIMEDIFDNIKQSKEGVLGNTTLEDLIEKTK